MQKSTVIEATDCSNGLLWQLDADYGVSLKEFCKLCLRPEYANVSVIYCHHGHSFAMWWQRCGIIIESFPYLFPTACNSAIMLQDSWIKIGCFSSWLWKLRSACSPVHNCWQDVLRGTVRLCRWYSWELATGVMQFIIHIDVHKSSSEEVSSLLNKFPNSLGAISVAGGLSCSRFCHEVPICRIRQCSAKVSGHVNWLAHVPKQRSYIHSICVTSNYL